MNEDNDVLYGVGDESAELVDNDEYELMYIGFVEIDDVIDLNDFVCCGELDKELDGEPIEDTDEEQHPSIISSQLDCVEFEW